MKSALDKAAQRHMMVISECKESRTSESLDAADIPETLVLQDDHHASFNLLDGFSPEARPVNMLFKAKSFTIKGMQKSILNNSGDDDEKTFKHTSLQPNSSSGPPRPVPKMGRTHSIHTTTGFFATTIMKKIERGNNLDLSAVHIVKKNIGRGADAFVHHARYNKHEIALKHYKFKQEDFNDKRLSSFENELNILKRFKHHNVVLFMGYHLNINQKGLHFAFEYTTKGDLFHKVHPIGPKAQYPYIETIRILLDIAKGMEHIHSKYVIHRDLNPRNILIFKGERSQSERYCVTDFGESLLIDPDDDFETPSISDKNSVGSAGYKAPEIIKIDRIDGMSLYNYKVDVFSFGSMCYEVYTKKFVSGEVSLKDHEQLQSNEWVTLFPDDCPEAFGQLLWECWQFDPAERPGFSQLVVKLTEILQKLKRAEAKETAITMSRQHSATVRRHLSLVESQEFTHNELDAMAVHPDMLQLDEEDEKEDSSFSSAIEFGDEAQSALSPTAVVHNFQPSGDLGRPLNAKQDFGGDQRAFDTWKACCDVEDETFGYYSALYPLLTEIFLEKSKCSRIPKQADFELCILKQGGVKMLVSKLHKMNVSGMIAADLLAAQSTLSDPPSPKDLSLGNSADLFKRSGSNEPSPKALSIQDDDDSRHKKMSDSIVFNFDNPQSEAFKPKYLVTLRYKVFYKFWKWFLECCAVIGECPYLWENNTRAVLACDLFMTGDDAKDILQKQPLGTFVIRLAHSLVGGVHVDYCESGTNKQDEKIAKHVMLIRKKPNEYSVKSHHVASEEEMKLTTLSAFIRSFVKIKYLYTMKDGKAQLYPKKSCFKAAPPSKE